MQFMDSMASLFLYILTLLTGFSQNHQEPSSANWEINLQWVESELNGDKRYIFECSSDIIPDLCRANTDGYVSFPAVVQASHLIYFDNKLAQSFGDPTFKKAYAVYGGPLVKCSDLAEVKSITWRIVTKSKFFSHIKFFPEVVDHIPLIKIFHETLYVAAAGITFILMLISLIVFYKKVSTVLSISMITTNLTSCLYFVFAFPQAWGIEISLSNTHKLMILSVRTSVWLFNYIFCVRGLLSRKLFILHSILNTFALLTVLVGHNRESVNFGSLLSFWVDLAIVFYVFVSITRLCFTNSEKKNFLLFCSGLFFSLSFLNDILFLVRLPIIDLKTLPIGMVAGQLFLLLSTNDEILEAYRTKEKLALSLEKSEKEKIEVQKRGEINASLAKASQMLVHDIRKPFVVLDGFIRLIMGESDAGTVKEHVAKYLPFIRTSTISVNKILDEFLELGRPTNYEKRAFDIEKVILLSIQEVVMASPRQQDFHLYFNFSNSHKALGDSHRIKRVLCNIVQNALEASNNLTTLSFHCEERANFLIVKIENDGSHIPKDKVQQVFRAFYTEGKSFGTGLGLAISQKIIEEHGGSIWCESDERCNRVCFSFTIPKSQKIGNKPANLPTTSFEVVNQSAEKTYFKQSEFYGLQLQKFQKNFMQKISSKDKIFQVALVEDEPVYANYIAETIKASKLLASHVNLIIFNQASDFLHTIHRQDTKIDLVICDIDLGDPHVNGFQIARSLRKILPSCKLCLHSNAMSHDIHKEAIEAGADFFFVKPLTELHLLKILTTVTQNKPMEV